MSLGQGSGFRWFGLILCAAGPVLAETIATDLGVSPGGGMNMLTMKITATIPLAGTRSDSKTGTVTGNVLANVVMLFDPLSNAVANMHTLELTGGHVGMSDLSFKLDWGWLFGSIDLVSRGIGGTFDTPTPPGLVIGGSFSAAEHQVILNEGVFQATGKGVVGGAMPTNPYIIDVSQKPMAASSAGMGTVTIGAPVIGGGSASYSVVLKMPVAMDQVMSDPANPSVTVRVQGAGALRAAGSFTRALPVNVPTWDIDGGGNWSDDGSWKAGTAPNAVGATAWLLDKVTAGHAPATIALDGERTVGTIVFENANRYVIEPGAGGVLRLDNGGAGAVVHVIAGSQVVAAPVQVADGVVIDVAGGAELAANGGVAGGPGRKITKRGAGAARVRGGMLLDAASSVSVIEGVLDVDRIESGAVRVGAYGVLAVDADGTAGKASAVNLLELAGAMDAWTGKLDLGRGRLIVQSDAANAQQVLAQISNQIKAARNGAGGLWTGRGIGSSAAEEDARRMSGLGVMLNNGGLPGEPIHRLFGSQRVDANSILVRSTWNGDANLDGVVNADDYFQIDSGFISQKGGWYNGDFNYDGAVNADDYFLIDGAFIGQSGPLAGGAAVPEPAGVVVVVVVVGAAAGLLRVR